MKKLKVGIIGLGVGEQHIEGYNRHHACEVTALCDFSESKCAMARQKYPHMQIMQDNSVIINDPDINIISIASFDNYHFDQIVGALKKNKHVFVEKPVCLFENELVTIRSILNDHPHLKISSNLILRMCPRFRNLRNLIQNGEFGELFCVEGDYNYGRIKKIVQGWRGQLDFYSVVYGGAIHMIDLLRWMIGDEVVEVSAYGNKIVTRESSFKYNDLVVAILKFKSGLIGKVNANFGCIYPHFHKLSIYGTLKSFENNLDGAIVYESHDHCNKINDPYPGTQKGDLIYSFVDSIVNGTVAEVGIEDVFRSMSICFAIEKAVKESCKVAVNYI